MFFLVWIGIKAPLKLEAGEVIDASVMRVKELRAFFRKEIEACQKDDLMISLHMKATMMKISDPIIFGAWGCWMCVMCVNAWSRLL